MYTLSLRFRLTKLAQSYPHIWIYISVGKLVRRRNSSNFINVPGMFAVRSLLASGVLDKLQALLQCHRCTKHRKVHVG